MNRKSSFFVVHSYCYIYGYVLEAGPNTVGFFGLEQEQSQSADKIELIKKNMDAMAKTIKLI